MAVILVQQFHFPTEQHFKDIYSLTEKKKKIYQYITSKKTEHVFLKLGR